MRLTMRPTRLPALLVVLCSLTPTAASRGDEPPRPPGGEARLESGRVVDYTIHFDRNSLRDSVRLGDGLIALTSSGTLLRFELPAVRLLAERLGVEEVTCLGRGEGDVVLAGLADGRVCRVDPATLALTDVVKLSGTPQWVGWVKAGVNRPAGVVAVTVQTRPRERNGERWEQSYSVVHDPTTGKTLALEFVATAYLLDRAGRFWVGADQGEWGGRVARADLIQGTIAEINPPRPGEFESPYWQGVYGFVELKDGQVWAFGGVAHMGYNTACIWRIDGAEPRQLVKFDPPQDREKEPDPNLPGLPITHVVEEEGGLLVLSYSDVFRVDPALRSWKQVATLDIRYRWGRPNAIGAAPSVCALHPPRREGEPYVLATVGDGYVLLDGAKATAHALPGQLGAAGIDTVRNTAEGTLFIQGDDDGVWRLGANGWEVASLAPSLEPDPGNDFGDYEKQRGWSSTRVLVGPKGGIYTVSDSNVGPGTRITCRRVDGKSERIGRETSSLSPSSTFITADGTLWNIYGRDLKRFEQGTWETVARLPRRAAYARLEAVPTEGPPWLLLEPSSSDLWRLETGVPGTGTRVTRVKIQEGEQRLRIDDAIPWTDGALLLATGAGLRVFSPGTEKLSRVDFPEPEHPATVLVRDGRGRLWLGGEHGLACLRRERKPRRSSIECPGSAGAQSATWRPTPNTKTVSSWPSTPEASRSFGHGKSPDRGGRSEGHDSRSG